MDARDDTSDSEADGEAAKRLQRDFSPDEEVRKSRWTKEGFLFKQTHAFQRWVRCCFTLTAGRLHYTDEGSSGRSRHVPMANTTVAECSVKNINHCFQVITPHRSLVLCADSRRDMEDWITAIRSAAVSSKHCCQKVLSGDDALTTDALPHHHHHHRHHHHHHHHSWCTFQHVRPLYCNVCRDALSSVTRSPLTLNALSCEVCKVKVHKRCAVMASSLSCKWTTLASVGDEIIEEDSGRILMPHQWVEGNLPVNARCYSCDKTCGSIRRLQDFWCLWCHSVVHAGCRASISRACSLGQCRVSMLPPTAITSLDSDGFWRATRPPGTSPLLVFLNSKSGDSQGIKMLWKFKQLLNPAQVFDLISGGPNIGLRLFQNFESFRVLVCGGDGSVGWVLTEIDKLDLHKQCQIGVMPLGTGNDLSRVLGCGAKFDDESQLPVIMEQLEHAQIKMLDRWSIYTYETSVVGSRQLSAACDPMAEYKDIMANHLSRILHSDSYNVVISSATVLCSIVKELVAKLAASGRDDDTESVTSKCSVLNQKLDALIRTLHEESHAVTQHPIALMTDSSVADAESCCHQPQNDTLENPSVSMEIPLLETVVTSPATTSDIGDFPCLLPDTKFHQQQLERRTKHPVFRRREQLMSRANSLKKAIRQIIEHTESAVDEQNNQTLVFEAENTRHDDDDDDNDEVVSVSHARLLSPAEIPHLPVSPAHVDIPDLPVSPGHIEIPDLPVSPALIASSSSGYGSTTHGGLLTPEELATHSVPLTTSDSGLDISTEPAGITTQPDGISRAPSGISSHLCGISTEPGGISTEPSHIFSAPGIFTDAGGICREPIGVSSAPFGISSAPSGISSHLDGISTERSGISSMDDATVSAGMSDIPHLLCLELPSVDEASPSDVILVPPPSSPSSSSPPSSSLTAAAVPPNTLNIPAITTDLLHDDEPPASPPVITSSVGGPNVPVITTDLLLDEEAPASPPIITSSVGGLCLLPPSRPMASLAVPGLRLSLSSASSDGESSFCSTPGNSTPEVSSPGIFTPEGCQSPFFIPQIHSPSSQSTKSVEVKPWQTRQISRLSTLTDVATATSPLTTARHCRRRGNRRRHRLGDRSCSLPRLNLPLLQTLHQSSSEGGGSASGLIGKVLLANADALCAAATPLVESEEIHLDDYEEKCVMNNYFGIGLDAKIALEFHQKREEHPEKCRSRTKNMMWFGVLGGKEILARTYRNLDQRVTLDCDGRRIPLPNLQGIVVLNIPSYMGGTNFWGGTKENDNFIATSFDDNILEVVAVFGSVQLGISRVINLQRHRIAQCRTVKITVSGDEGVPVQVDGEAWLQQPGVIYITHKNRAQMLTRHKVFEEALKTWLERQKITESMTSVTQHDLLSPVENNILLDFVEVAESLIRSVKLASICSPLVEQELLHLATQASGFLDRLYPDGRLCRRACRVQVSDLVNSVHSLYTETQVFINNTANTLELRPDITSVITASLSAMDDALKKVYEIIGGLPHYTTAQQVRPADSLSDIVSKEKTRRGRWSFMRAVKHKQKCQQQQHCNLPVCDWSTNDVCAFLRDLDLGEHCDSFIAHDIRGRELLTLGRTDLKELGVSKLGHIKRLQQATNELKKLTTHEKPTSLTN